VKVAVSILKTNKDRKLKVKDLNKTDCDYLHIDMMDGNFVNNTSFTIDEIKDILKDNNKKLDIHLMVNDPISYVENMMDLNNINDFTFHVEVDNKTKIINKIKEYGFKVGLAINPDTDIRELISYLPYLDIVLIMGVTPGEGGQELIMDTTKRIEELIKLREKHNFNYEINFDGGVNNETRKYLDGLDIITSGSYICMHDDLDKRINSLR